MKIIQTNKLKKPKTQIRGNVKAQIQTFNTENKNKQKIIKQINNTRVVQNQETV